jgi:ribonuclease VapC
VLDASALLAWLREEPGADIVAERLAGSHVSAVNLSEVLQKSLASGADAEGLADDLLAVGLLVADFGAQHASIAAEFWASTRHLGLGVAARACLATAVVLEVPVLTADRAWAGIEREGLFVELIR